MLKINFHKRWFGKKIEWEDEVEIFHRDLEWEARGVQGTIEIVRGQEGEYWPEGKDQVSQIDEKLNEIKLNEEKKDENGNNTQQETTTTATATTDKSIVVA